MDYTLTEDQEQLRRLVEDFVTREVKPYWEKHGYEDFPWPLFRKLGELGLAVPTLAERWQAVAEVGVPRVDVPVCDTLGRS